jgi:5-methylcytosine-specific restriction enzyme subunit McrC
MELATTRDGATKTFGYVGRIPVRNLWLLMFYASDLFRAIGTSKGDLERQPDDLPELVAEMLAHAVEARQRRQLSAGYRRRDAVLNRVRGRIDALTTERRQLLARGQVACRFADLTVDTPRNRFVRGALTSIARLVTRPDLAHRCRALASILQQLGVSGDVPTRREMGVEQFGRNDADDRLMVAAAQLAFDLALPTELAGPHASHLPDRDEAWVRRLFERGVAGLYEVALRPDGWTVRRGTPQSWAIDKKTGGIENILPSMRTDIILDHARSGHRLVIDTKFNAIVTPGWYKDESLRSGYVYQMYAYLRSQAGCGNPIADTASGIMLHPSVGVDVDEAVLIQGHAMRFATVDLTVTATDIRARLLAVTVPTSTWFTSPE